MRPASRAGEFSSPADKPPFIAFAKPNLTADAGWTERFVREQAGNSQFATSVRTLADFVTGTGLRNRCNKALYEPPRVRRQGVKAPHDYHQPALRPRVLQLHQS